MVMQQLAEREIGCPYCGELIEVLIDPEEVQQEYIEDCQVCCRPIVFYLKMCVDGEIQILVRSESDTL